MKSKEIDNKNPWDIITCTVVYTCEHGIVRFDECKERNLDVCKGCLQRENDFLKREIHHLKGLLR